MNCTFSQDLLALHVEGDLGETEAATVTNHLAICPECREFLDALASSQSSLKALRQETFNSSACSVMRRQVMATIEKSQNDTRWSVRLERAVFSGLRRQGFALASFTVAVAMVSAVLLAELRTPNPVDHQVAAAFDSGNRLLLPTGYRDWVSVSRRADSEVFVSPSAYRAYIATGSFPEGTVVVKQSDPAKVQVSVKDSRRFSDGWGFFDFSAGAGEPRPKAAADDDPSCRSCHKRDASTDRVLTQISWMAVPASIEQRSVSRTPGVARLHPKLI